MKLDKVQKGYVTKWKYSGKDLKKEEKKWGDFLWLGRSLAIHQMIDPGILDEVIKIEQEMIEKYADDPEFLKYMVADSDEYVAGGWREINNNVGALRYILFGDWNLDS